MINEVSAYHQDPNINPFYQDLQKWPRHNNPEMVEVMLTASDRIMAMNADKKNLVTDWLSALVVESSGRVMFNEAFAPRGPILWLGHNLIAQELNQHHQ